jgi:hypothetical protein
MAFELLGISAARPRESFSRPQNSIFLRAMRFMTLLGALAGAPQLIGCADYDHGADLDAELNPDAPDAGIPVRPTPDGGLPITDGGTPVLPGSVFDQVQLTSGTGASQFDIAAETPMVTLTSGYIEAAGISDIPLAFELWTDPTAVVSGLPAAPTGCIPGLVDSRQLSPEEIAYQTEYNAANPDAPIYLGCEEPNFQTFVACPDQTPNQVPVYVGQIRIQAFRVVNGRYLPVDGGVFTQTLTNISSLYDLDAQGTQASLLGVGCAPTPPRIRVTGFQDIYRHTSDRLVFRVSVSFIADRRQVAGQAPGAGDAGVPDGDAGVPDGDAGDAGASAPIDYYRTGLFGRFVRAQ